MKDEIYEKLNVIFEEVFGIPGLRVTETTTAADVPGWDSLMHIALISEVEETFGVHFTMNQILNFQNVGELAQAVLAAGA